VGSASANLHTCCDLLPANLSACQAFKPVKLVDDFSAAISDPMRQFTAKPDKGHRHMLAEFIREIRGERGPVCSVEDAVKATRVCLAAAESYAERREVELSEIEG
jgi:predicted dehydrogenase